MTEQISDIHRMSKFQVQAKSVGIAYIFALALGVFGAHRFYLNRVGSAIVMLILGLSFIGLGVTVIWTIIDLLLIPDIVRERNNELALEILGKPLD